MINNTGWTYQEVEATPWTAIMELVDFWKNNPPIAEGLKIALYKLGHTFDTDNTPLDEDEVELSDEEEEAEIAKLKSFVRQCNE